MNLKQKIFASQSTQSNDYLIVALPSFRRAAEMRLAQLSNLVVRDVSFPVEIRVGRSRARKTTYRTAFPGYLFLAPAEAAKIHVSSRPLLWTLPVTCSDEELDACERILMNNPNADRRWLFVGDYVRVIAGPFSGFYGVVKEAPLRGIVTLLIEQKLEAQISVAFLAKSRKREDAA